MDVVGDVPLVPMVLAELVGPGDVLVNVAMALNEPVVAEDVVLPLGASAAGRRSTTNICITSSFVSS